MPTKTDLEDRVAELEEENQNLHDKLDSILDIASPVDEPDENEEEQDGDSDEDEY